MVERDCFIETREGLKLFVREIAPDSPGSLPPVLCLHGLTRNSRDFEDILPRIAGGGRRALALDVRGRGFSDRDPDPMRYQPATYATDVLTVLDHLEIERAAFVGTSMGGLITMAVAGLAPDRIERAVLNDVGPELDPRGLMRIFGYVGGAVPVASWTEAADRVEAVNRVAFPQASRAFFERMARKQFRETAPGVIAADYDLKITVPLVQAGAASPIDPWALWAALKPIPTMVVRGGLSDLLSAEILEKMRAANPGIVTVEAAEIGHAPMLDEPDVWPVLARFLELRV